MIDMFNLINSDCFSINDGSILFFQIFSFLFKVINKFIIIQNMDFKINLIILLKIQKNFLRKY